MFTTLYNYIYVHNYTHTNVVIMLTCIVYICIVEPPALTVNITKKTESSSVVVQWDEVDDSLHTIYIVTWTSERDLNNVQVETLEEQSSYTITGLTLDTVYTITVTANNKCGTGPEYSTSVSLTTDATTTRITPTTTVGINLSTNPSDFTIATTTATTTTTATITTTTATMVIDTPGYNTITSTIITSSVSASSVATPFLSTSSTNPTATSSSIDTFASSYTISNTVIMISLSNTTTTSVIHPIKSSYIETMTLSPSITVLPGFSSINTTTIRDTTTIAAFTGASSDATTTVTEDTATATATATATTTTTTTTTTFGIGTSYTTKMPSTTVVPSTTIAISNSAGTTGKLSSIL